MHFVAVPLLNGDTADVNIDQITHMRSRHPMGGVVDQFQSSFYPFDRLHQWAESIIGSAHLAVLVLRTRAGCH